jgi:hypothetical protein
VSEVDNDTVVFVPGEHRKPPLSTEYESFFVAEFCVVLEGQRRTGSWLLIGRYGGERGTMGRKQSGVTSPPDSDLKQGTRRTHKDSTPRMSHNTKYYFVTRGILRKKPGQRADVHY